MNIKLKNKLIHFKKSLRKSQTEAESKLWYHLRNRHFQNYKFRRQHILCGYIVDFVCLKKKIIIELDGSQHAEKNKYDSIRTQKLEKEGFRVLRFWNSELFTDVEGVLEAIYAALYPISTSPYEDINE